MRESIREGVESNIKSPPPPSSSTAIGMAHTLRRPAQHHQLAKDTVEAIPNSNAIDSAMYERDKQIYKCSTMRHGGKYDTKTGQLIKPSILNCPLPEIPKKEDEATKQPLSAEDLNNSR